jgi:hypothetical protein
MKASSRVTGILSRRLRRGLVHLCLSPLLLLSLSAFAQSNDDSIFSEVPPAMRKQFVERLSAMVGAMRDQKYEDLYKLLSRRYSRDESLEGFVARLKGIYSKGDKVIDFVPDVVMSNAEPDKELTDFIIVGCLEMSEAGHRQKVSGSVEAFHEDGNFYFSELSPSRAPNGKYLPCEGPASSSD